MIILFACFSIYRYRNLFFEKKTALLDSFSTFRLFAGSQFVVLGASVPHTRTHSHTHTHTRILCLRGERERERFCFILWKMPMQVWAHLVQCCGGSPGAVGCCSLLFERWTCWCGNPLSLLPGTPHSLHQLLQPCHQSETLTDCFCAEKFPGVEIECKSSVTLTAVLSSVITWFTAIRVRI